MAARVYNNGRPDSGDTAQGRNKPSEGNPWNNLWKWVGQCASLVCLVSGLSGCSRNHDPYGEVQEYNHNVTRIKELVLKLIDDEQEGAHICCVVGGSVRPKREASRVH